MKKLLAFLIAMVMVLSSIPVASATQLTEVESKTVAETTAETQAQTEVETQIVQEETIAPTVIETQPTEAEEILYPQITSIEPASNGLKICWEKFDGAYSYRLFIKRTDGTGWKTITTTSALSYTHTGLTNNTEYIYTLRVVNADGKFGSEYNKNGWTFTYLSSPVLKSVSSERNGLKVTWNKVEGAVNYKVYVKITNGWRALGFTTDNFFVDENVESGKSYRYTVKCVSADGKALKSFHTSGLTGTFVATPEIIKVENVANGAKVTWNKVDGSAKYKLFYKLADGSGWKTIGTTTADNYTHSNLTNGDTYTYTVRACNNSDAYVSSYDKKGVENTFFSVPVIKSVSSALGGLEIKWEEVKGAENYKIYVKTSSGWKALGYTTGTSFVDTTTESGTTYTYTVRCVSADGTKFLSYFDTKGVSGSYIETPLITKVENLEDGIKVTWTKVGGVSKYKLFYKKEDGSGWKTIGTTTQNSYTHRPLSDGETYTYTVRGCDSSGNYISGYDKTGVINTFIAPLEFSNIEVSNSDVYLQWDAVEGASYYQIYRKVFGGIWKLYKIKKDTSLIDRATPVGVPYAYSVRCVDENDRIISYYSTQNKYFYNGELADGAISVNGSTYNFVNGGIKQGYVTINGDLYYYDESGILQKNGIVGTEKEGYCLADANGVIDLSVRKAYSKNGQDWNILDGKAYKVVTNADRTLFRAFKELDKALKGKDVDSLTDAQKLKICFDYVKGAYVEKNPRIPHYNGMDWPQLYANDMFVNGVGNCFSYGAAFAYMAKAIGYENVYCCHSGGHGWAEIDGLVYDPEWSRHHSTYSYYALSYNTKTDQNYKGAIAPGYAWMHVKI